MKRTIQVTFFLVESIQKANSHEKIISQLPLRAILKVMAGELQPVALIVFRCWISRKPNYISNDL